jgi:hypothetical protein
MYFAYSKAILPTEPTSTEIDIDDPMLWNGVGSKAGMLAPSNARTTGL